VGLGAWRLISSKTKVLCLLLYIQEKVAAPPKGGTRRKCFTEGQEKTSPRRSKKGVGFLGKPKQKKRNLRKRGKGPRPILGSERKEHNGSMEIVEGGNGRPSTVEYGKERT